VAPILSIGSASLVAISTLTSEINFYTRLIKMVDPATDRPLFATRCIELCCEKCKEDGKSHECVHMLHLVPSWQSAERHRKLKIMMQDRPDLIQSELAGLAFDSLQQVFRKQDLILMFDTTALALALNQTVWIVIDPAAGGPQSDYALISICRIKGCVVVRVPVLTPLSPSYTLSRAPWSCLLRCTPGWRAPGARQCRPAGSRSARCPCRGTAPTGGTLRSAGQTRNRAGWRSPSPPASCSKFLALRRRFNTRAWSR